MNSIGNLTTSWLAFFICNNFGAYAPISWVVITILREFFLRALMRKIIILGLRTILKATFLRKRTKKLLTKRSCVGARGLYYPRQGANLQTCAQPPRRGQEVNRARENYTKYHTGNELCCLCCILVCCPGGHRDARIRKNKLLRYEIIECSLIFECSCF